MRTLLSFGLILIAVVLASCSYEDRIAMSYALKRAAAEPSRYTVYCSTSTYGRHSTTSCF